MTASAWKVHISLGDMVKEGQELIILESMKMEIPLLAPVAGQITHLAVAEGDSVQEGMTIMVIGAS